MKFLSSLFLATLPALATAKAILGVDLGSVYMKVALVQRGAPLEIVTNLHSKRRTENMILFDSQTRFYGADANSLYGRKPEKTPSALSIMLGRDDDHPSVTVLTERHYPITPKYNETRAGVSLTVDGQDFTPEELVAMLLSHARDMTIAYGMENFNAKLMPKDLVLTVPSFSTQHERKALLDAAALADFNVLALIDETTAAALHFGMDKIMEEPKIYIFYNLGASSLQVSVVKFLSYSHKDGKFAKEKIVGGLEVMGKAWDATLGGSALDHRIVEYLANIFNKEWGTGGDVRDFPRPMAKLRVQANKVKHVLSANTEFPIYIDSLHAETPLKAKITRAILEDLCGDLLERATQPIADALARANVTLEEVDGIELIGGGMRVPKIQEYIQAYLGEAMELGLHINSDESMALGASFHGANISTAFKVRHVGMADINPFAVKIGLSELDETIVPVDGEDVWSKQATMFKTGGKVGVKKTIAFTHDQDVHCQVDYEESDLLPIGTQLSLERYNITGVKEFAAEMKKKELGIPKVSLQFELSNSGITRLVKAEAAVEELYTVVEEEEIEDEDAVEEEEEEEVVVEEEAVKEEEDADTAAAEGEEKKEEEKKDEKKEKPKKTEKKKKKKMKTIMVEKEKKKTHKRLLTIASYHVGRVQPYSPELMAESKAKMDAMAFTDKERQLLESSRNKVESFIYRIKNKLIDDADSIHEVSTEEQREAIAKLALAAEEWMYDDGYNADLPTMEEKYVELAIPADKIFFRVAEATARPAAIMALKKKLENTENLIVKWETTHPQITEEERISVMTKVTEIKEWLTEKEVEQNEVAATEDPVLLSAELPGKTKLLEPLVTRLSKKPKPKPKKNATKEEDMIDINLDNKTTVENETMAEDSESTAEEKKEGGEESVEDEEVPPKGNGEL